MSAAKWRSATAFVTRFKAAASPPKRWSHCVTSRDEVLELFSPRPTARTWRVNGCSRRVDFSPWTSSMDLFGGEKKSRRSGASPNDPCEQPASTVIRVPIKASDTGNQQHSCSSLDKVVSKHL